MNPLDRLDQNGNVIAFVKVPYENKSGWGMLSGIALAIIIFFIGIGILLVIIYPPIRQAIEMRLSFLIPNNEGRVNVENGDSNSSTSANEKSPTYTDKLATPSSASDIGNKWCLISDLDRARRCIPVLGVDECQSKYVYDSKNTCESR